MFSGVSNTDKKKVVTILKFLEDWLKNYKSVSLVAGDDEEEEEKRQEVVKQNPYCLGSFKELMNEIVEAFISRT